MKDGRCFGEVLLKGAQAGYKGGLARVGLETVAFEQELVGFVN